jgi:hypothetical protein
MLARRFRQTKAPRPRTPAAATAPSATPALPPPSSSSPWGRAAASASTTPWSLAVALALAALICSAAGAGEGDLLYARPSAAGAGEGELVCAWSSSSAAAGAGAGEGGLVYAWSSSAAAGASEEGAATGAALRGEGASAAAEAEAVGGCEIGECAGCESAAGRGADAGGSAVSSSDRAVAAKRTRRRRRTVRARGNVGGAIDGEEGSRQISARLLVVRVWYVWVWWAGGAFIYLYLYTSGWKQMEQHGLLETWKWERCSRSEERTPSHQANHCVSAPGTVRRRSLRRGTRERHSPASLLVCCRLEKLSDLLVWQWATVENAVQLGPTGPYQQLLAQMPNPTIAAPRTRLGGPSRLVCQTAVVTDVPG